MCGILSGSSTPVALGKQEPGTASRAAPRQRLDLLRRGVQQERTNTATATTVAGGAGQGGRFQGQTEAGSTATRRHRQARHTNGGEASRRRGMHEPTTRRQGTEGRVVLNRLRGGGGCGEKHGWPGQGMHAGNSGAVAPVAAAREAPPPPGCIDWRNLRAAWCTPPPPLLSSAQEV